MIPIAEFGKEFMVMTPLMLLFIEKRRIAYSSIFLTVNCKKDGDNSGQQVKSQFNKCSTYLILC